MVFGRLQHRFEDHGMNGGAVVSHNGMPLFHVSYWELLRKAFRGCAASLAHADLAIREGAGTTSRTDRWIVRRDVV